LPESNTQDAHNTSETQLLLAIMPHSIQGAIQAEEIPHLVEIVLDLGRPAEIRLLDGTFREVGNSSITQADIDHILQHISPFSADNRSGITRTLHRISAIRNRQGAVVGLTCRVGRVLLGTIEAIADILATGKSILLLGRPGVGKTTKLREMAKVLANEHRKRVVIVDTSNEIAGDGDIPHPVVGRARRMQVRTPLEQENIMIEAVENHMPEVIVIDEIGTEAEAQAARTIAERGVSLIATAHGTKLENLIKNPVLSDLIGGIQSVTLGDEEARRRATQKTILEREKSPTFEVAIELRDKNTFAVYLDVGKTVDDMLRGFAVNPEIRKTDANGEIKILSTDLKGVMDPTHLDHRIKLASSDAPRLTHKPIQEAYIQPFNLFLYAVTKSFVERILERLQLQHLIHLTTQMHEAHAVLALRGHARPGAKVLRMALDFEVPCFYTKTNTMSQIQRGLREALEATDLGQRILAQLRMNGTEENGFFAWVKSAHEGQGENPNDEIGTALEEVEAGIQIVLQTQAPYELEPRRSYVRRLQHDHVEKFNLLSVSVGAEPDRYLKILPNPQAPR
jgi:stage III sporulation protein SpoIIIAA/predicted RNA-binding protein Jag